MLLDTAKEIKTQLNMIRTIYYIYGINPEEEEINLNTMHSHIYLTLFTLDG